MALYCKQKLSNYFIQALPDTKDIVAIKFYDGERGQGACLTWGRVFKEEKLLDVVKAACNQHGFENVVSIELCYSLQEVVKCSYFYESWIYFVQQHIPYKRGFKEWVKLKQNMLVVGYDIKILELKKE